MKNSLLYCALSAAFCSGTWAAPPAALDNPEVFVGGVFSRPVGPAVQPLVTSRFRPELPFLFDRQGKANQIMVLLDFADPAIVGAPAPVAGTNDLPPAEQIRREAAVLIALNTKDSTLSTQFGKPLYSDYLLWETRQTVAARSRLKGDSPSERLERYLLLTYESVEAASAALTIVRSSKGVIAVEQDQKLKFASVPYNDPYAQWPGNAAVAATYQWGHYAMNFINASGQGAHDVHQGHGYVATLDGLGANSTNLPADLMPNVRQHLSSNVSYSTPSDAAYGAFHGTFVNSIIAAKVDNATGISGACPNCALMLNGGGGVSTAGAALAIAKASGAPVVNMSFGTFNSSIAMDVAIASATQRDVAMFAASGNENLLQPNYPARNASVLSVGGVEQTTPTGPWPRWVQGSGSSAGANWAGVNGVVGPAKDVVSLVPFAGASLAPADASLGCGDGISPADISGPAYDGAAACRGTSFATPYVAALGAILRSINPLLSRDSIYAAIRASSGQAANAEYGGGMPNALNAVNDVINQTPNRLTPLFSLWSSERSDYFYTTVPQMAASALNATLLFPTSYVQGYASGIGNYISGYAAFPNDAGAVDVPTAGAWIFTTKLNPVNANAPLVPLYRLSWKCGDYSPTPPAVCSSNAYHMDTTYTTDQAGITAFEGVGYKLDGIEGFIYPKTAAQPAGSVRLMRKYAISRDDHAIFPEGDYVTYATQGYTQNSGSDWLGYVYPNGTGTTPSVQ